MPFHEIREVTFSATFNSVWDRRRRPELTYGTAKRPARRHGGGGHRPDPAKEVDILA